MSGIVLDTSALLAPIFDEPDGDVVAAVLGSGAPLLMSAVNLAEAVGKLVRRHSITPDGAKDRVLALGFEVVPFDAAQAVEVGALEPALRGRDISLGDRACLTLGRIRELPVLTADRSWAALTLGVEVRLIR